MKVLNRKFSFNRYVTIQRGRGQLAPSSDENQVGNDLNPGHRFAPSRAALVARLNRIRVKNRQNGYRIKRDVQDVSFVLPSSSLNHPSDTSENETKDQSLPRSQGVSYIFPFSNRRRDERQVVQPDTTFTTTTTLKPVKEKIQDEEESEEDDEEDGWDYVVSVGQSVSESFSLGGVVQGAIDVITSTLSPLISKESTEVVRTSTSSKSDDVETTTTTTPTTTSTTTTASSSKSKKSSPFPNKRIHPFLAAKRLAAQNETTVARTPLTTRRPFFKSRLNVAKEIANKKVKVDNEDITTPIDEDDQSTTTTTKKPKKNGLKNLINRRLQAGRNAISDKKPRTTFTGPKFTLPRRLSQRLKTSTAAAKATTTISATSVTSEQTTTISTTFSFGSTSRFVPTKGTIRNVKVEPAIFKNRTQNFDSKPLDLSTSPSKSVVSSGARILARTRSRSRLAKIGKPNSDPVPVKATTTTPSSAPVTTEKLTVGDILANLHGITTEKPKDTPFVRSFKPKFGSGTRDKLRQRLRNQLANETNSELENNKDELAIENDIVIPENPPVLPLKSIISTGKKTNQGPRTRTLSKLENHRSRGPSGRGRQSKPRPRQRQQEIVKVSPVKKTETNGVHILSDEDIFKGLGLSTKGIPQTKEEPSSSPLDSLIVDQKPQEPKAEGLNVENILKSAVVESHIPKEEQRPVEKIPFLPLAPSPTADVVLRHRHQPEVPRTTLQPSRNAASSRSRSRARLPISRTLSQTVTNPPTSTSTSSRLVQSRVRSRSRVIGNRNGQAVGGTPSTTSAIPSTTTEDVSTGKDNLEPTRQTHPPRQFKVRNFGVKPSSIRQSASRFRVRSRGRQTTTTELPKIADSSLSTIDNSVTNIPPSTPNVSISDKDLKVSRSKSRFSGKDDNQNDKLNNPNDSDKDNEVVDDVIDKSSQTTPATENTNSDRKKETEETTEITKENGTEEPIRSVRRRFRPSFGSKSKFGSPRKSLRSKLSSRSKVLTTTTSTTTTTFAAVSPTSGVTSLPVSFLSVTPSTVFVSSTPALLTSGNEIFFGSASARPSTSRLFIPTPSPLTRIGRSTIGYPEYKDDTTKTPLPTTIGTAIKPQKGTKSRREKIGLFGGKRRVNFLKKLDDKIAKQKEIDEIKKKEDSLQLIQGSKLLSRKVLNLPTFSRPRRKLEIPTKTETTETPETSKTTEEDITKTTTISEETTTSAESEKKISKKPLFPGKPGKKFPFKFNGPLKPTLLSFKSYKSKSKRGKVNDIKTKDIMHEEKVKEKINELKEKLKDDKIDASAAVTEKGKKGKTDNLLLKKKNLSRRELLKLKLNQKLGRKRFGKKVSNPPNVIFIDPSPSTTSKPLKFIPTSIPSSTSDQSSNATLKVEKFFLTVKG